MEYCWLEPLYSSGLSEKQRKKTIQKMRQGKFSKDAWAVVLPFGERNLLEIYPSYVFLQKGFPYGRAKVLGITKTKRTAFSLVRELVDEAYQATGTVQIREYFEQKLEKSHKGSGE